MGAIGGLIGTAGGANGSGFSAPQQAQIQQPTTSTDVTNANAAGANNTASANALLSALQGGTGVAQGMTNAAATGQTTMQQLNNGSENTGNLGVNHQNVAVDQQAGLNGQLGSANGVGIQSGAAAGQQGLTNQLASANGVGTQNSAISGLQGVAGQQASTAAQLQGIANGTGPNPALAQLNQATGQNVSNQAALMAGQRGAGANVGLLARQAAQQGASTQQQAVGQAAILQANQSLGALGQMTAQQQAQAGTQAQIGALGTTQVGQQQAGNTSVAGIGAGLTGQQQTGINAGFQQGATQVGQQQTQQGINAGIAQNQVGNAIAGQGVASNAALGQQSNVLGGIANQNNAMVSTQNNINSANAGLAGTAQNNQAGLIGGAMNIASPAAVMGGGGAAGAAAMAGAGGGLVAKIPKKMAQGGELMPSAPQVPSTFAQYLQGVSPIQDTPTQGALPYKMIGGQGGRQPGDSPPPPTTYTGQPTVVGPTGEVQSTGTNEGDWLNNNQDTASFVGSNNQDFNATSPPPMAKGGLAAKGGHVAAKNPKEKAVKKGNSYDNDKVPAMLSEGEIVIPRSVMQGKDPVRGAADFVAKVMAKKGRK